MILRALANRLFRILVFGAFLPLLFLAGQGAETNIVQSEIVQTNALSFSSRELPQVEVSFLRLFGGLGFVIGIFLLGVWGFRHWQRTCFLKGHKPLLEIHEVRSIGNRQSLVVVGYQNRKMLVASGPSGSSLISHLSDPLDLELDGDADDRMEALPSH